MKEQVQADVIITSSKQDERILKILQGQGIYTACVLMYYSIVQHDSVILIVLLLLMLNYLRLGKLTKTALLTFHFISVWFTQKYMRAQAVVVMLS